MTYDLPKFVLVRGRDYRVEIVPDSIPASDGDGFATAQIDFRWGVIRIRQASLSKMWEDLIHEMLHALAPDLPEDVITEMTPWTKLMISDNFGLE